MQKNIFDRMTDYSMNEGMDGILLKNREYMEVQDKIEEQNLQFDKLNLTKEQCLVVDRLISAYAECGAVYGKLAYRQGFRDCAELLLEMKLLKAA